MDAAPPAYFAGLFAPDVLPGAAPWRCDVMGIRHILRMVPDLRRRCYLAYRMSNREEVNELRVADWLFYSHRFQCEVESHIPEARRRDNIRQALNTAVRRALDYPDC